MPNTAPYSVLATAADIYLGTANETQPAIDLSLSRRNIPDAALGTAGATSTGTWYYLGYTEGGVRVADGQTIKELTVDQVVPPVKTMRTAQKLAIRTTIAELTMENLRFAMNMLAIGTALAKSRTLALDLGISVATLALLVRFYSTEGGANDGTWLGQYYIPYCYQSGNPEAALVKGDKAGLAVEFTALLVGTSLGMLAMRTSA